MSFDSGDIWMCQVVFILIGIFALSLQYSIFKQSSCCLKQLTSLVTHLNFLLIAFLTFSFQLNITVVDHFPPESIFDSHMSSLFLQSGVSKGAISPFVGFLVSFSPKLSPQFYSVDISDHLYIPLLWAEDIPLSTPYVPSVLSLRSQYRPTHMFSIFGSEILI